MKKTDAIIKFVYFLISFVAIKKTMPEAYFLLLVCSVQGFYHRAITDQR
jgi:hypothetical protein